LEIDLDNFRRDGKSHYAANQKIKGRLKKNEPKELDEKLEGIHGEVFQNIDCLDCAN